MSEHDFGSTLKIIIIGSGGVGKTSLLKALFCQSFDEQPMPSIAPSYSIKEIQRDDGVRITLQIWDTAGQERYNSINQLFYRNADIACICYDPKNLESKESLKRWIDGVRDKEPHVTLYLVLTKSDLYLDGETQEFKDEAEKLMEEYAAVNVFITSALNNTGIEDIFRYAAETYKTTNTPVEEGMVVESNKKSSCC